MHKERHERDEKGIYEYIEGIREKLFTKWLKRIIIGSGKKGVQYV